jgi:Flp pilus assembly protein TadG
VFFRTAIRRFFADARGNVAIICAVAFLPLLIIAGGATDIARHEAYRVQLQDGVDRAVLAAASLTQTRPIEETVEDYLQTLEFADDVVLDVDHTTSTTQRQVTVVATYQMATAFLPLVGINSIDVSAKARAVERRKNIEISLMLDISGSMRFREPPSAPTRISLMIPAAKGFIDAIVTPATSAYTSVSIVPYAGSVNPGQMVFNGLGVPRQHNYSSCVEFGTSDFGVGLIPFNLRSQTAHFTVNHQGVNEPNLEWSWCPYEATSITYLSNNATTLKARIDAMKMHDGTGTAIAMNWGMLLLEPGAQPMVAQAVANGMIPAQFANRPAAFNDPDTLKFIVLMTDGDISDQHRPNTYAYPRTPAVSNTVSMARSVARDKMYAVCNRAKQNGVVVFTIGFQLTSTGQTEMRNCASSPSHFYDVAGLDIAAAFQSIATSIQKIRLTE